MQLKNNGLTPQSISCNQSLTLKSLFPNKKLELFAEISSRQKPLVKAFCLTGALLGCFTPWRVLAITPKPIVHGTAFAQLSSKVDQQPGKLVQFELKDSLQGITATNNSVTVMQPGTYLVVASPQVTAVKDGGCLDAWIVLNGKDVKNSGVRICQAKAGNTNVVVSQIIMKLKPGDKIQVKTSGKNVILDSIVPTGEPLIPSIIFTMFGLY